LELVLRSNGSSISQEVGRTMMYPPGPGKLIDQRDVNVLLIKLTYDKEEEVSTLACIMEFLKRGGSPNERVVLARNRPEPGEVSVRANWRNRSLGTSWRPDGPGPKMGREADLLRPRRWLRSNPGMAKATMTPPAVLVRLRFRAL
jgi:hypothetical protein